MTREVTECRKSGDVIKYLDLIAEPTLADFGSNPQSQRLAFLACVAAYHAIDRVDHPPLTGNLKRAWGKRSIEFAIVDLVAHHFKHVKSNDERKDIVGRGIPLYAMMFKNAKEEAQPLDLEEQLHNLYFIIRDAIRFIREECQ